MAKLKIGIIGTGWVGKTYAKNFISRGLEVVCYSLENDFVDNYHAIRDCDIVFICVPTPTTKTGADYSALQETLQICNNIVVIKSTLLPGTTFELQKQYPALILIHYPEFLSVSSADFDAANPKRNIIGLPVFDSEHLQAASLLASIIPKAPYTSICTSTEAEIIKYSHNIGGYLKVVFHNMLYDVCESTDSGWDAVKNAIAADNNILAYLSPVHKSGRGAGGGCFIKDFAAFSKYYERIGDKEGSEMLASIEKKNNELLINSGKDLDILKSIAK